MSATMTTLPLLKTQPKAILLMILCTAFTSAGQILWKFGVQDFIPQQPLTLLNVPFVLGTVAYGLASIFLLFAFRNGELSVVFPIVATSYVWVSLFSAFFLPHDFMTPVKWTGVALIVGSVSLLGWSGTR